MLTNSIRGPGLADGRRHTSQRYHWDGIIRAKG